MDFTRDLTELSDDQADLLARLLDQVVREQASDAPPAGGPSTPPRAVCIQAGAGLGPLFLVHGSGGQVMFLHAVARRLAPAQPLYGIDAGGSWAVDAGAMVLCPAYLAALRSVQPKGPYRLGAYSAGCLIVFEMAARLEAEGERVETLLLIDPIAPPDRRVVAPATPNASTPALTAHERLRRRFEMALLAGVTPLSSQFGQIEQVNRMLARLASRFDPRPLDLPIRILHGLRGAYVSSPQTLDGWATLALRGLEHVAVDADHFELVREPHVAATGRQIQAWLDALPPPDPAGA